MMINPLFQRQGLGSELLRQIENSLGQRYDVVHLESFEANEPANAFYLKHGWTEVRRYFDKDIAANKILFRKVKSPINRDS